MKNFLLSILLLISYSATAATVSINIGPGEEVTITHNGVVVTPDPVDPIPPVVVAPPVEPWLTANWSKDWRKQGDEWDVRWATNGNRSFDNNNLIVSYPKGWGRDKGNGFKAFVRHTPRDVVYLEYDVTFDGTFPWVKGGKAPGLAGGNAPAGGRDSSKGWSARYMWRGHGECVLYLYHPGKSSTWGQNIKANTGNPCLFKRGKKHTLGQKVDVPNNHIQVWLDGKKVIDVDEDDGIDLGGFQVSITRLETFFGGGDKSWAPTHDAQASFGPFKYSDKRP